MPDKRDAPPRGTESPPDVTPAFQMLRAAQDAESVAMEALLLSALEDEGGDVDRASQAIENAIAQHRAASEELTAMREVHDGDQTSDQ